MDKLIEDLEEFLQEVKNGDYGDFTSTKHSTPKMALVKKIYDLRDNTINGKYDG